MSVSYAIQQSCCVPGVFFPIKYKNDTIVDGGIIDNFPIYYFNDETILPNSKIQQINPSDKITNPKTLGILIIDPSVSKDPNDPYLGDDNTSTFFGYCSGILNTLLTTNSRCRIGSNYWESIISINIGLRMDGVSNMDISEELKENLIEKGRESAKNFLKLRDIK
jgi:predicted acylesterase/phospholipase RssA